MSRLPILTALLVLPAVAPAAPVPAAKPEEPVPAATARLLAYRKVQKELKMSGDQRTAIVDGLADVEEAFQKALDTLGRQPDGPDPDDASELEQRRRKGRAEVFALATWTSLTPAQRARLRQVDRHLRGPAAFTDPVVQKGLQLTDAQKKAAADLAERATAHAHRYLDSLGGNNHEAAKKEALDFRAGGVKAFVGGLTADQQATWKAMLGDPVKGFDPDGLWLTVVGNDDDEPAPDK